MKYLYWIFGLVVVAGVGYASYQYGVGNWKPNTNTAANNTAANNMTTNTYTPANTYTPTNTATNTTTNATTVPASWKTYTNKTLGFSIQYPPDYAVVDKLQKDAGIEGGPNSTLTFTKSSDPLQPRFSLYVNPAGFGPFFSDIFYKFTTTTTGTTVTERTVMEPDETNTDGYQELFGNNGVNGAMNSSGNYYGVDFRYKEGGANYESVFTQILTSLKNL